MPFPALSENPEDDKIWVSLRNPRLIPPEELRPKDVQTDPVTGQPVDLSKAEEAMYAVFAKLIVGWRVYDASQMDVDLETGEPLDQTLLPMPATPALVAKLPGEIMKALVEEFTQATNPR